MNYDIKNLDCEKMWINPQSPLLIPRVEKEIPSIANIQYSWIPKRFTKAMVIRYIVLMYDKNSPIRQMHALDWMAQKFEACAYSGFDLKKSKDGYYRFDQEVVDMVLGKNDTVNDMIIAYIGWCNNHQWDYSVYLKESMLQFTRDAVGRKITDYKSAADYKKLYDDYRKIAGELSREKEETEEFLSRFYYQIEQSRLAIRPEDYAKALNEGSDLRADNPYGVNFAVDKIRFIGDEEPAD